MRAHGQSLETFRAINWCVAPIVETLWRPGQVQAKWSCRLWESNRIEGGIAWGSGHVVRALELQHDLTGMIPFKPLVGQGGSGEVAAPMFPLVALIDGEPHVGREAKPGSLTPHPGADGGSCVGTVGKVSTFWPARGPSAMR